MKWFVRLVIAVVLSVLAVAALTWAGWPRPRFVVPLPETDLTTEFQARRNLSTDHSWDAHAQEPCRSPWLGFVVHDPTPLVNHGPRPKTAPAPEGFWFVNTQDGRAFGPTDTDEAPPQWGPSRFRMPTYAWDARGAAVIGRPQYSGAVATPIDRLDPETGRLTRLAESRGSDFLVSANGATLLTFSPTYEPRDREAPMPPPGDADFVCYDLTAEPPTRTRLDFTIPGGQRQYDWRTRNVRGNDLTVRVGAYALSPDGLTVAVSETWRRGATWKEAERMSPLGVTLYDTRTGLATGRVTDYGPELVPAPAKEGAFGLAFSPDSRGLLLYRRDEVGLDYPPEPTIAYYEIHRQWGEGRYIDLATKAYVPTPPPGRRPYRDPRPVNLVLRTDDGGLRTELEGDPARPDRFRVVDADGSPRCDWRPLAFGGGGNRLELGARFVPGTTGFAYLSAGGPEHWLVSRVRKLLRMPPTPAGTDLIWYDWATDEQRVICRAQGVPGKGERVEFFAQPNRLALLKRVPLGGTVEIWDAPPPRPPWLWSVPGGVALGVLLTAIGVRLRVWFARRATATPAGGTGDTPQKGVLARPSLARRANQTDGTC